MASIGPMDVPCPGCGTVLTLPATLTLGRSPASHSTATLHVSGELLHAHVADCQPSKEFPMSAITDELHALIAKLENEGHALADKFRAAFAKLKGDETQLATDAEADVQQVEADAAPVVAEAETDGEQLAAEAVADAKDAAAPTAPTA